MAIITDTSTFDVRSWKGLARILALAKDADFTMEELAALRDTVRAYSQSGGFDEKRRVHIEDAIKKIQDFEKRQKESHMNTTEPKPAATTVVDDVSTITPQVPPVSEVVELRVEPQVTAPTEPALVPKVPEESKNPVHYASVADAKVRIAEIKRDVHELIGNPLALVESYGDVGRKYMEAILNATRSTIAGSGHSVNDTMQVLESRYETLRLAASGEYVGEIDAPKDSHQDVVPETRVPVVEAPAPIISEEVHKDSIEEDLPVVSSENLPTASVSSTHEVENEKDAEDTVIPEEIKEMSDEVADVKTESQDHEEAGDVQSEEVKEITNVPSEGADVEAQSPDHKEVENVPPESAAEQQVELPKNETVSDSIPTAEENIDIPEAQKGDDISAHADFAGSEVSEVTTLSGQKENEKEDVPDAVPPTPSEPKPEEPPVYVPQPMPVSIYNDEEIRLLKTRLAELERKLEEQKEEPIRKAVASSDEAVQPAEVVKEPERKMRNPLLSMLVSEDEATQEESVSAHALPKYEAEQSSLTDQVSQRRPAGSMSEEGVLPRSAYVVARPGAVQVTDTAPRSPEEKIFTREDLVDVPKYGRESHPLLIPQNLVVQEERLRDPAVSESLSQLLREWPIFRGGLFSREQAGEGHSLYRAIKDVSMSDVLSGRFEGAKTSVVISINDYVSAWRHEQGVDFIPIETFEHYLRRVILRIMDRTTQ